MVRILVFEEGGGPSLDPSTATGGFVSERGAPPTGVPDLDAPQPTCHLADELARYDFADGAGPKLKAILQRGVGVHHAGVLPKYRRIVEELFQQKLLSVCVCTETLAAGNIAKFSVSDIPMSRARSRSNNGALTAWSGHAG